MEALRMDLSERIAFFRKFMPEYLGMASALGLCGLIPGLIILLMPLSIIGATDVVAKGAQDASRSYT
jgi:hypothetical protein